mgnify:CR=1 FL=1
MKAINSFIVVKKIKEKPNKIAGLEITESYNDKLFKVIKMQDVVLVE